MRLCWVCSWRRSSLRICRNSWRCRRISVGDAGFVVEEVERSRFVVGDVIRFVVGEMFEFVVVFVVVVEDGVGFLLETWLWMWFG